MRLSAAERSPAVLKDLSKGIAGGHVLPSAWNFAHERVQMDREIFAAYSAQLKCGKILCGERRHGRGGLCKSVAEKFFFATHSANPRWRKNSSRCTLQIQNGRKLLRAVLCKSKMDENFFAPHSANPKWTKTSSRRTLQIQNGRKILRAVLCKSKMDANFFAPYSANPKWTQTSSRRTLQIQNGRKKAQMAADSLRHAEIPVQLSQILLAGVTVRNSSSEFPSASGMRTSIYRRFGSKRQFRSLRGKQPG
jgi:hypothetical protein